MLRDRILQADTDDGDEHHDGGTGPVVSAETAEDNSVGNHEHAEDVSYHRLLNNFFTTDNADQDDDDRNHQKDMNKAADGVRGN